MVEPKPDQPKRIITWDQYWAGIQDLKRQLQMKNWNAIGAQFIGIPRGGIVLNTLLTYCYRREAQVLNWDLSDVELLGHLSPPLSTFVLVDDIVDSGQTMQDWTERLREALPKNRKYYIRTITLFKRYNCPIHLKPDIFYQEVKDDSWLKFPYEED